MSKHCKRRVSVILAVIMIFSLTGCNYNPAVIEGIASGIVKGYEEGLGIKVKEIGASDEDKEAIDSEYEELLRRAEEMGLPSEGDVISGFEVKGLYDYPAKNAIFVDMEHVKSGAKLVYLANGDSDKAFNVFYRTTANDNKGIPHIFEHVTLSGSGKYPNSTIWDVCNAGTYNTYMNAMTSNIYTGYMVSSLSDDQLLALTDFYMDGLTDPLALRDSHPLGREAYRLELWDSNDEINVTGAVFNEMESVNSNPAGALNKEMLRTLFPGSVIGSNTGGERNEIIMVTVEELKEFYDRYYHPSNMLICLYGNMDYLRYLELLDKDYLSKYDRQEVVISDDNYVSFEGYKELEFDFPASEDAESVDSSSVMYAISLDGISLYDYELMDVLAALLRSNGSPVKSRIEKEYPGAIFDVFTQTDSCRPYICFYVDGINRGDGSSVASIIKEELVKLSEEPLNKDRIAAFVNKNAGDILIKSGEPCGLDEVTKIGSVWAINGSELDVFQIIDADNNIITEAEAGKLDELISKYLANPVQSVCVTANPCPGLYEEEYAEFKNMLAELKASLNEEEIQALISSTEEFAEWSEIDALEANKYLDIINVTDVGSLEADITEAEINETQLAGTTLYTSEIENAGYVYYSSLYDAGSIPVDKVHDFVLLCNMLGNVPTKNYTADELSAAMNIDLYDYSISLNIMHDCNDKTVMPYLCMSYTAINEMAEAGQKYMEEVLFNSDFSDIKKDRQIISNLYMQLKQSYNNTPDNLALYIAEASQNDNYKYDYYARGFEYMAYLKSLTEMSDEELEAKMNDIETVLAILRSSNGMINVAIGDKEGIDISNTYLESVIPKLPTDNYERVDYKEAIPDYDFGKSIAVVNNDSVVMNGFIKAGYEGTDICYDAENLVTTRCVDANVGFPLFRYNIGAYGFYGSLKRDYLLYSSYRDPELAKSFEALCAIPDLFEMTEITQSAVDSSILSVYSELAYPSTAIDIAKLEVTAAITGSDKSYSDEIKEILTDAKKVTPDDVKGLTDGIRSLFSDGTRFTCGNAAMIQANSDLYDTIFYDLVK